MNNGIARSLRGKLHAYRGATEVSGHQTQGMGRTHFFGSIGDDERDTCRPDPPPDVAGQPKCDLIRPMHVLQDQHYTVVLEQVEHAGVDRGASRTGENVVSQTIGEGLEDVEERCEGGGHTDRFT
jgi:hypothetical protein